MPLHHARRLFSAARRTRRGQRRLSPHAFDRRVRWSPQLERLESRLLLHAGPPDHQLTDHIHAQLDIFINGAHVAIPGSIGVQGDGTIIETLHTHERGGRLHQHPINGGATVPADFHTLGDFFDVWQNNAGAAGNQANATFSSTVLMGNQANATHTVRMFVNGIPNDEFENYRFHEHDSIVLSYEPIENTETVTLININTSQGVIPIQLFHVAAPLTVANILNYVHDGDFVNSLVHRSDPGFVIQGGGFTFENDTFGRLIPDDPVLNEPGVSNLEGTVALARQSGGINSGTSQWFVNLGDNSFLDTVDQGFTVFGRVIGNGLEVANAITDLDIRDERFNPNLPVDVRGALRELPVVNFDGEPYSADELVIVSSVTSVTSSIKGIKFADLNGNGMQDAGEDVLEGWTIYLDANENGVLDAGETSTVTNSAGEYEFGGLGLRIYHVREVLRPGWTQTTPSGGVHIVTLTNEAGEEGVDFGNQLNAPTGLALSPSSDTGRSTSDRLTRLNNSAGAELQFTLSGLIVGATVTLVDTSNGDTVLAQVTANAASMTITTNGTAILVDGQHAIVARQTLDGVTSPDSITADITIDRTPSTFLSTPIETVMAGGTYQYDVDTDDEASGGVVYALSQSVTGMTLNPLTGAIRWIPTIGQVGSHNIIVRATDDANNSADQTFAIEVTNQAPVLALIDDVTVDEGATVSFTATATDLNQQGGDTLTFSLGAGAPQGATIDSETGEFSWTTTEEDGGQPPFAITVIVTDQLGESDSQVFMVTVNEVNEDPVIAPIAARLAIVDMPLNFTVAATDTDLPSQTLTYSLIGAPTGASIDANTGVFSWMPTATGTHPIEVRVSDGISETGQMFTVYVQDTPAAPVLETIANQTVDEHATLTVTAVATDANLPNDKLTYSLATGAPDGATIDADTGELTWTPDETQGGNVFSITVEVTDVGGLTDSVTFSVTVNEVNQAPVIETIDDLTVDEGMTVSLTVNATDDDLPADVLTYSLIASDAPTASIDPATGQFTWITTEEDGGQGIFNFTVQVTDGTENVTASFAVTVNEVNQPPVLAEIANQTVAEGATVTFTATATDPDLPANTLSFSLGQNAPTAASIDPNTGDFSWITTEADGQGDFTFMVIVRDGAGGEDSRSVTITVDEVNAPPVLDTIDDATIPEGQLFTFTATATDPDLPANDLTFSLDAGAPVGVSLDPQTGVFSWTPSEEQGPGEFTITLRVNDGQGSNDAQTFTLTVTEVNAPPVLDPIGNQTINVGGTASFQATATDPDVPQNTLTFNLGAGAPDGATIDPTTGQFSWTPTTQQGTGAFDVTVIVSDNTGGTETTDSESFQILVNAPPIIDPISDRQVNELSPLSFDVSVDDPTGVTFRLASGAPAGASIDPQTGRFSWTPSETQGPGTFQITVVAERTGGQETQESFSVTVNEVNRSPVINPIGDRPGTPGTEMQFTVTASDPDRPANNLRFSLDPGSPSEAMIDPVTGLFWWTIPPDFTDTRVTFTVRVTDDGPGSLSTTQSFDVLFSAVGNALFAAGDTGELNTARPDVQAAAANDAAADASTAGLSLVPAGDDSLLDGSGSNFATGPDTGVAHFWQTLRDGPLPGDEDEDDEDNEDDRRVGEHQEGQNTQPRHAAVPADDAWELSRAVDEEILSVLASEENATPMATSVDQLSEWIGNSVDPADEHVPSSQSTDVEDAPRPAESRQEEPRLAAAALAPMLFVSTRAEKTRPRRRHFRWPWPYRSMR